MARILTLDAALGGASAGVVIDGAVVAERIETFGRGEAGRGQSALLAPMAADVLNRAGLKAADLDHIAVTLGPGSFTGLRAAIALAGGMALASGRPLIGVDLAACFAAAFRENELGARTLWTAIDSRRGRVFLHRGDGEFTGENLDDLPDPAGPAAVAGDAAIGVAARLAARGHDVMLTRARLPPPLHIAAASMRGRAAEDALQPIYVDPPEAKPPRGGLRPPPRR